jgi:hypothetical protein
VTDEMRKEQLFRVKERFDETIEDVWHEEYMEKVGLIENVDLYKLSTKQQRDRALRLKKRDYEIKKGIRAKQKPSHHVENVFFKWASKSR